MKVNVIWYGQDGAARRSIILLSHKKVIPNFLLFVFFLVSDLTTEASIRLNRYL